MEHKHKQPNKQPASQHFKTQNECLLASIMFFFFVFKFEAARSAFLSTKTWADLKFSFYFVFFACDTQRISVGYHTKKPKVSK
jgi:hypothetical protein